MDELASVEAALIRAGISDEPQLGDLDRVLDLVDAHPELDAAMRRLEDLVRQFADPSEELQAAIQARAEAGPVPGRVLGQLLVRLDAANENEDDGEVGGLQADLDQQLEPLSSEIEAWARVTGGPTSAAHAFNDEANAASFARVLARLRDSDGQGTSSAPQELAEQVSSVIRAIANDADLRAHVFSIAEDALGTCGDNLLEGFSKIRLAVDNHQMAKAVETGQVDAKQLNDWAGSLFRLSLLESAVHRYIHAQLQRPDLPSQKRHTLTEEPMETMLHAKVALRETLGLPNSTASRFTFRSVSVLGVTELRSLEREVRARAADLPERAQCVPA